MKQDNVLSQEFIDWALKQLESSSFYYRLLDKIKVKAAIFYLSPKSAIKSKLEDKLLKGMAEHGDAVFEMSLQDITKEAEFEYIDLIGWELIRQFKKMKLGRS